MGRRGPKLQSVASRLLTGNRSKRPIKGLEPDFKQGDVQMTPEVRADPVARAEWQRRAQELQVLGVLTPQDRTEFAGYCTQHALAIGLLKEIRRIGYERAIRSGVFKAYQAADAARSRIAGHFGFTPLDRNQIKVEPPKQEDPAEKYLRGPNVVPITGRRRKA